MPEAGKTVVLYGITSCDQVRRARRWLETAQLPYRFHDFRRDGLERERLQHWLRLSGWETLLNRQSTTWRALPTHERPTDARAGERALLAHPTLIKRPVLEAGDALLVGFSEAAYQRLLQPSHDG